MPLALEVSSCPIPTVRLGLRAHGGGIKRREDDVVAERVHEFQCALREERHDDRQHAHERTPIRVTPSEHVKLKGKTW